jgi:hypothetical protein
MLRQPVDEGRPSYVAPLLVRLDQGITLQHGQVLADARGREPHELAQLLDGGLAVKP